MWRRATFCMSTHALRSGRKNSSFWHLSNYFDLFRNEMKISLHRNCTSRPVACLTRGPSARSLVSVGQPRPTVVRVDVVLSFELSTAAAASHSRWTINFVTAAPVVWRSGTTWRAIDEPPSMYGVLESWATLATRRRSSPEPLPAASELTPVHSDATVNYWTWAWTSCTPASNRRLRKQRSRSA